MRTVLLVIAGPNGAGKTTLTARLRYERWSEGVEYLNPDEIARDRFGDWNSPTAVLSAARWTAERREELLAERKSIAFETVMSTDEKLDFVGRAKDAGYFVRLFFIATSDPRINAGRIAERVISGGHGVPIEKIVTRHIRAVANLASAIALADRAYVYDNSVDDAPLGCALEHKTACCERSAGPCRCGSKQPFIGWNITPTSRTCAPPERGGAAKVEITTPGRSPR